MTDDAHEECFRQHDKMLRSLTAMLVKQDGMTYTKWENGARTLEGVALRLAETVP